jgi:hypothetical protein
MPRLISKLRGSRPTLCISLIRNEPELAKAAQEAGADALKLHTNLSHGPSGITIPDLDREADRLQAVLEAVDVPVGIVPRGRPGTGPLEVERLRDMGFDFVDLYARHVSPAMLAVEGITKWAAATPDYTTEMLRTLAGRKDVDVLEAAFLPVEVFGSPLNLDDLVRLELGLAALDGTGTPLVLPTDRRLAVDDLPVLHALGLRNYLLGYAVTGADTSTVAQATGNFRKALDKL